MVNPTAYFEGIFKENPSHLNLSDGNLLTEDGFSFRIHKSGLAIRSKYFFALFCGLGKEKKDYMIPGISGEVLSNILSYIYFEQIHVTERNFCDIIVAADYLLLDSLLSHMETQFEKNLSVANCLAVHLSLWNVNSYGFLRNSYRFLETHFEEIIRSVDVQFYELPLEFFKQLLCDRNIRIENETVVWQAIVKWVESDLSNRLQRVPDLLLHLGIYDVHENLAREILTHAIVARNLFCKTINFRNQSSYKNVLKLHQYYVWNDTQFCPFYISRKPLRLNFIAYYDPWEWTEETEIYVTYDECLDLWRKIIKVNERPSFLVSIQDCIYIFFKFSSLKLRYNVINKQWVEFRDVRVGRHHYSVVILGGFLYILGGSGIGRSQREAIYDVEIYDPEKNAWHDTSPILPIAKRISAVTLNDVIYVVGINTRGYSNLSAQTYDSSTKVWNEISHPSFLKQLDDFEDFDDFGDFEDFYFSLAAYKDKIYVIIKCEDSDTVTAESFDPLQNVWLSVQSLPYTYMKPRAIVINDQLIVCEDLQPNFIFRLVSPPVQWSDVQESWETLAETSPLFNIHYYFFVVQDGASTTAIFRENKMPAIVFEKCPLY